MAGPKVLVVDPEPLVRSVIIEILTREGYTVRATASCHDAQELARTFRPDLMLTNIHLSDMTGHEAAKLLRAEHPDMRVLMVTGLPDDDRIRERTADDERYDMFPKPFSAQQLTAKVREMLRIGGQAGNPGGVH